MLDLCRVPDRRVSHLRRLWTVAKFLAPTYPLDLAAVLAIGSKLSLVATARTAAVGVRRQVFLKAVSPFTWASSGDAFLFKHRTLGTTSSNCCCPSLRKSMVWVAKAGCVLHAILMFLSIFWGGWKVRRHIVLRKWFSFQPRNLLQFALRYETFLLIGGHRQSSFSANSRPCIMIWNVILEEGTSSAWRFHVPFEAVELGIIFCLCTTATPPLAPGRWDHISNFHLYSTCDAVEYRPGVFRHISSFVQAIELQHYESCSSLKLGTAWRFDDVMWRAINHPSLPHAPDSDVEEVA